jgi:hypothetical protein
MSRIVCALAALLLCLPATRGFEDPKDKPKADAASPAAAFKELTAKYDTAYQEFLKEYRAAKTNEERQKILREKQPKLQEFTAKLLEIAEKNAKDPAAVDCLIWIVQRGGGTPDGRKAVATLTKDHIEHEKLGDLCVWIGRVDPNAEKTFREIIAKNKHKEVQGQATFALAELLQNQANRTKDEAKAKEAEGLLDEVVKKYADVKSRQGTLGQAAEQTLFEVRNLAIGKTVPEIEAEDTDGKKFKLSDYRGKVVMIDFWGHW